MGKFVNTIEVMGQAAFTDAFIERTLTEFKDEYITKIADNAFSSCSSLKFVDLPNVTQIAGQAFMGCGALETLVLRSPLTQQIGASWCNGTAIQNGNGYVYVPSSEITRFSSMAYVPNTVKVRALEDYTVDGTIMGELDYGPCTGISLNASKLTFTNFDSQILTASATPKILKDDVIVWASSDDSIAIVSDGVVTPLSNGECEITVTCGDYSATCMIIVKDVCIISNNLLFCESSNPTSGVLKGTSYTTTLTSYNGNIPETVSVIMNGVDVTSSVYSNGVVNIKNVTGDIVITASAQDAPSIAYSLSKRTTFNGTSDYIDTGIQLFDIAKDFTIICVADFSSLANNTCICHCMRESAPYPGLSIDGFNNAVRICYSGASSLAIQIGSFSSVKAIALRYINGILNAIRYVNASGEIVIQAISGAPTYAAVSQNLILGAYQNASGGKGRYFKGNISTFDVYEVGLNDETIDNILSILSGN